jgi:hypothetical protein
MAKKYDLSVKTGEYTDGQGQTKGRYMNIGVMMENDKGPYILLNRTFNPAGVPGNSDRDNIMVSLFEPRDGQGQNQAPAQQRQASGGGGGRPPFQSDIDDGVPF